MTTINPRLTQMLPLRPRRATPTAWPTLVYAFDDGPELVERIRSRMRRRCRPSAPAGIRAALETAAPGRRRQLLQGRRAGANRASRSSRWTRRPPTLLDALYLHGLGEFAYRNGLDLRGRIAFPARRHGESRRQRAASRLDLACRSARWCRSAAARIRWSAVEALKAIGGDATAVWIGNSPLIAACAAAHRLADAEHRPRAVAGAVRDTTGRARTTATSR